MASDRMVVLRRNRGLFVAVVLLCVVAFVGSRMLQTRALKSKVADAQTRAHAAAALVNGQLPSNSLAKPLDGVTTSRLKTHLASEPVIAIRVWSPSGVMRFSSLGKDGSPPLTDLLKPATKGQGRAVATTQGGIMTTYLPLRAGSGAQAFGAVEVQQSYAAILAAAASPWSLVRTGAEAVGAIALFLLLLGFVLAVPVRRKSKTGVGFAGDEKKASTGPAAGPTTPEDRKLRKELAASETAKQQATEELEKVKAQLQSDHDRAGARIEELQGELERVNAKLKEAQVAATARPAPDPLIAELEAALAQERRRGAEADTRVAELEGQMQQGEERLRATYADVETLRAELEDLNTQGAEERDRIEARGRDLEEQLEQSEARLRTTYAEVETLRAELEATAQLQEVAPAAGPDLQPEVDRLHAETAELRAHIATLDAELGSALDRAREAEDLVASLQATPAPEAVDAATGPDLQPEIDRLLAETAELRARNASLDGELGSALERAREAEDLAAALQDRLSEPGAEGEAEIEEDVDEIARRALDPDENPLDAFAARQGGLEPSADGDTSADDLRSRLTRAAARKKGHIDGEPDWP